MTGLCLRAGDLLFDINGWYRLDEEASNGHRHNENSGNSMPATPVGAGGN